jgi:hypothetical protein
VKDGWSRFFATTIQRCVTIALSLFVEKNNKRMTLQPFV